MTALIQGEAPASIGEPRAIGCLQAFESELDYVYRTLRRLGVSAADIEDLAQDVFVVMWRRWADYDQNRPVRPWLAGIACHLAMKHLSRRRREVQRADADQRDDTALADERLASARVRALVLRALAALPDRHRAALTQHELEGLSVRELSSIWSVPLFTAYTRLRAARRAFARAVARLQPEARGGAAAFLSSRALLSLAQRWPPA
jgi:RNA polymerase sigma factor (sigma-70 family)